MLPFKKIPLYTGFLLLFQLFGSLVQSQTVDFTISQPSGCSPLSVNFTDISSGATVVSRFWDLGNGVNSTAAVAGANYFTPQKYYISLTVQFDNGVNATKTDSIIVHPKPIADFFSNDTIGCTPHLTNFTHQATTATGTITDFLWDFGAGGSSSANPSFTYFTNGLYPVSLVVKNNWGCQSDANTKPQYIKVLPAPVPSFQALPDFSCRDSVTVQFNNTTVFNGYNTFEWNFGDGSPVNTSINPVHFYGTPGQYTVQLKAKLGNTCSQIFTKTILVGSPVAAFVNAPDTVCKNTPTLFTGSSTPSSSFIKWLFLDDNSTQFNATAVHSFTLLGNHQIQLIAFNAAGCSDTITKTIFVKDIPQVNFTPDINSGVCVPLTVQFNNQTTGIHLQYTWNFGDGSPLVVTNSAVPVSHTYLGFGNFSVSLTAKDTSVPNGCVASKTYNYISITQPVVNFTYVPPIGCKPLPVSFTAQLNIPGTSILNYAWDFGEGPVFNSPTPTATHIYNNAGLFNVVLTITTVQGCTYTSPIKPVTVTAICDDDGSGGGAGGSGFMISKSCTDKYTIIFQDTVPNSIVQSWDFGDGSPILTTGILNPVTHSYTPPQKIYLVTVTRLDTITNIVSNTQKRIIIIDEKANFIPDIFNICTNKTVQVNTIGIDSSQIKNYFWDFGDGTSLLQINNAAYFAANGIYLNGNSSHTYIDSGTFFIRLILEDKLGCKDTFQYPQPIIVKGPIAAFYGNPLTTCTKPFLVNFRDSSILNGTNAITQWQWNFGDGSPLYTTTQDTLIAHTYNFNNYVNFYTVSLTITDTAGCIASVTKNNYIKAYQPKANFYSNDTLRCGNRNIGFNNLSAAYNAVYNWDFGDGNTGSGYNITHLYASDGTYPVTLTVTDENGCTDTMAKPAYIKIVKPKADFKILDSLQCAPAIFTFQDSSSYALQYQWDFGDGGSGSTVANPAPHIYGVPGYYTVTLKITGINGCTDSVSKQIRVRGPIGQITQNPLSGCRPHAVTMKVSGSFIASYAWDYGDGTPVLPSFTDSVVTHYYPSVGAYIPNVVLTSPEGCPYILKTDTVFVDSIKAKLVIFNNSVCQVGTINTIVFSNNSAVPSFSAITQSVCYFGDGLNDPNNLPVFSHSYNSPGVYDILLAVKSKYGCVDTLRLPQAVTVNSTPTITIQGKDTNCLRPNSMLNYTSTIYSVDSIVAYKWTIGTDSVANTPNLLVNYRIPGVHILKFQVTTIKGCVSEMLKTITIDSAVAAFNFNPAQYCGPTTVNFSNVSVAGSNILYYHWDFGDNTTAIVPQIPHAYNLTGAYTVKLVIESGLGCKDSIVKIQAITIDSIPKAEILGDTLHCKPGNYSYNSRIESLDSISNYEWKLNGNIIAATSVLQYNFNPGNYILSLKVKTSKGCETTVTKNIYIDSVKARFVFTPPKICGDTATIFFTNLSYSAFATPLYEWGFGDGLNDLVTNPGHFYAQAGVYDLSLKITSVHGCADSVKLINALTIFQKPVVQTIVPARACAKEKLQFTAQVSSQDSILHKTWLINNVPVGFTDSLGYDFSVAGNYTVGFRVQTRYGCDLVVLKNIVIDPLPVPNAGPNTTICLGSSVQLSASTGSQYSWTPTASLVNPASATPIATPLQNTKYFVVVTNIFGCVQKDSVMVNTDAKVNLQVGPDAIICEGFSTQLQSTANTNTILWSPPAGLNNSQIANPVASPAVTTQYMVVGYSSNVCKNDTGYVTVKVTPNPVIQAGPDRTVLAGVPTFLTTSASPFVVRYNWMPTTNLSCINCDAPTFIPNTNTEFIVTAFTEFGCKASDTIQIFVLCNKGAFFIPNAFTPNNDGMNDRFEIKGYGITRVNRFAVYDRYGHIVFERKNFKPGASVQDSWDGTVKGVVVNTATAFVYVAAIECLDGEVFNLKGTVVIVK